MNSNDYVKYLTEQFVEYMNQPRSERKNQRQEKKQYRKPVHNHLFGLIPVALGHYMASIKKTRLKRAKSSKHHIKK